LFGKTNLILISMMETSKNIQIKNVLSSIEPNYKEEIKKGLSDIRNHMEDYHFYRYIASFVESREKNKDIRHSIASWMCDSRHEDLPFSDIFVLDDEIYIYTYRPGLWIGRGGKTIDDCLYHINHKVDGTKYRKLNIHLIEAKDDAMTDVYGYMRVCKPYADVNEYCDYISDSDIKMAKKTDLNKIKI
jgi:uncharacterized protein YciU (UPF0263 family)